METDAIITFGRKDIWRHTSNPRQELVLATFGASVTFAPFNSPVAPNTWHDSDTDNQLQMLTSAKGIITSKKVQS